MMVERSREEKNRNKEMYVGMSTFLVLFCFSFVQHAVLLGMAKTYVEISMSSVLLGFSSVGRNIQTSDMFVSRKRLPSGNNAPSAPPWDWIDGLEDLWRRSDKIRW